jgi:hypothetical protein
MAYFSLVHSVILYGIILWGISTHSKLVFKSQKRIRRITAGSSSRDSCWDLFKKLHILPLHSQHIFSLRTFTIKYKEFFKTNS